MTESWTTEKPLRGNFISEIHSFLSQPELPFTLDINIEKSHWPRGENGATLKWFGPKILCKA